MGLAMERLRRLADSFRRKPNLRDGRSRKVILVPHCALNQNSRVAGAAERPAAVVELAIGLLERDIGIIQMPCPELSAFGLDRAHIEIGSELRTPKGQALCQHLAQDLSRQIWEYLDCGIAVLGILGKNGSPSCGVEETWANGISPGSGAFIEALEVELKNQHLELEMTGIRDSEPEKAIAAVDRWLLKHKSNII
jgi:predicted secreted protein